MTPDLEAIKARAEKYAQAIGPGGEKAWLAGVLAADVPALLAEVERLTQVADHGKADLETLGRYREEVQRLTAVLATVRTTTGRASDDINRRDWTRQQWLDEARQAFYVPFGSAGNLLNGHVSAMWAALAAVEQDRDNLSGELECKTSALQKIRDRAHATGAASIVTLAETALRVEVWDGSVPPGGFVCAVCRTPVESEPCAEHSGTGAQESDLIIYQAWDCDEIGWSDDNGMSGTDVEAVKLSALESFVAWSVEENWCGDPDEVERFEAELREGLHWRPVGKAWELHRGETAGRGNATWQGINIFAMKVSRDTVADVAAAIARGDGSGTGRQDDTDEPGDSEDDDDAAPDIHCTVCGGIVLRTDGDWWHEQDLQDLDHDASPPDEPDQQ